MNKKIQIIIAVIAILLIGGVIYVNSTTKQKDQNLVTSTDMKDWKTYSNEKYGFEIKYPADLFTKMNETEQVLQLSGDKGSFTIRVENVIAKESDFTNSNVEMKPSVIIGGETAFSYIKVSAGYTVSTRVIPLKTNTMIIEMMSTEKDGSFEKAFVNNSAIQEQIFSTLKFTHPSSSTVSDQSTLVITSITPTSGPVGTIVTIEGKNLTGFEGDLTAVFTRSDGQEVELVDQFYDYAKTGGSLMKVIADSPCREGQTVYGSYSGKPSLCRYFAFTPGVYKVRVSAFGKDSNTVQLTITN